MRVSAAIKSLIHGVTTDNKVNADPRYMAEQINTITRVDEGLTKRPPAEFVADMGATLGAGEFTKQFIIHDVAYFLTYRTTGFTVTREDGVEFSVQDNSSDDYLDGITEEDLKLTVHGELVFLLNNKTTVVMQPNDDVYITNSMLFIKAPIEQATNVTVNAVDHTDARVQISITVPSTLYGTAPDNVAAQIAQALDAAPNLSATSAGAVVQVVRTDGEYCDLTVDADVGIKGFFVAMNGSVESFDDLPRYAYHGAITRVLPENASVGNAVYMKAWAEGIKDTEDAGSPPSPVWPSPDFSNLEFKWYKPVPGDLNPAPLVGDPVDGTKNHFLRWTATHQNGGTPLTMNGGDVYRITVQSFAGYSNWVPADGIDLDTCDIRLTIEYYDNDTLCTASFPVPDGGSNTVRFSLASDNTTTIQSSVVTEGSSSACDPAKTIYYTSDLNTEVGQKFYSGNSYNVWVDATATQPTVQTGLILINWRETALPGVEEEIDWTTMPHVLQPLDASNFVFNAANWEDRRAGDNDTNPVPRFIGNVIEDIIIFQNRLTILTNDEVVASETNNVFHFFRDTVTQLLSKHPVNIRSTSANSSKLRFFVYHNRDLLITAGRQQYKIDGSIAFTPQTGSMQLTTSYNSSETVEPISIGDVVYLPNHHGNYLHLNRYEGSSRNLATDSADSITQHVRKYIDGTVNHLAGLPNHGLLFASASDGTDVFVCNYDTNTSRAEDKRFAWFKWSGFTSDTYTIASMATSKNTLLLAINTTTGLHMLKVDADVGSEKVYLDFQKTFTSVTTTVDVGTEYGIPEADLIVVQGEGCPSPGDYVGITSLVAGVITLDEDMTSGEVYVGQEFNVQAIPNLVTVRDEGGHVNNAANLRIRKFEVRVINTGKLTATERSPYDTYETQEFTGLVSGSLDAITDQEATTTDVFKVGFKQHADVGTLLIESKSWLPMTISQIDWVGNYKSRGRRF